MTERHPIKFVEIGTVSDGDFDRLPRLSTLWKYSQQSRLRKLRVAERTSQAACHRDADRNETTWRDDAKWHRTALFGSAGRFVSLQMRSLLKIKLQRERLTRRLSRISQNWIRRTVSKIRQDEVETADAV
jgi:hypothetical protein